MKILLDTSVLIDHLRGHKGATDALMHAVDEGAELWSVAVVRAELLAGMRESERQRTFALLDALRWIGVDTQLADQAGELARQWLRSHRHIDTVDYVVAAAARSIGAELWTRNIKHFPMFDGLAAPYS